MLITTYTTLPAFLQLFSLCWITAGTQATKVHKDISRTERIQRTNRFPLHRSSKHAV